MEFLTQFWRLRRTKCDGSQKRENSVAFFFFGFLTCGIRSNVEVGLYTEEGRRINLTGLELSISFTFLIWHYSFYRRRTMELELWAVRQLQLSDRTLYGRRRRRRNLRGLELCVSFTCLIGHYSFYRRNLMGLKLWALRQIQLSDRTLHGRRRRNITGLELCQLHVSDRTL